MSPLLSRLGYNSFRLHIHVGLNHVCLLLLFDQDETEVFQRGTITLWSSHRGLHLVAVDLMLKVTQFDKQVDNQSLSSSYRGLHLAAVDLVPLSLIRVVLSVSIYHSDRWPTTL